jgi:dimeric dUTPase (all-alpha-NTP-PPase superfamily)
MTKLTEPKLKTMMDLQSQMNDKVSTEWRNAGYAWEDAILTEAVEAYDHTYWAWWKNQGKDPEMDQIKMEVVDIWHFILSELMCHNETEGFSYHKLITEVEAVVMLQKPEDFKPGVESIRFALKNVMRAALSPSEASRISILIHSFIVSMDVLGMDWDELYKMYIGKNCLNQFRQENGYKTNTFGYKAFWAFEKGWEDNQYLTEILAKLDVESPTYVDDIKSELSKAYNKCDGAKNG